MFFWNATYPEIPELIFTQIMAKLGMIHDIHEQNLPRSVDVMII